MKKLITDYLQHRLPANSNFLQYISGEMHSNLIMLCESLYPDSENNAYILSGCERTINAGIVNYSSGIVFYNKEIFLVSPYSHPTGSTSYGLILQTTFQTEEYGSGDELPAYQVKVLNWGSVSSGALKFENMIRKDCYSYDINYSGTVLAKKEYKVISNHSTQTLTIHMKLLNSAITSTGWVTFSAPGFEKKGFLGMGYVVNRANGQVYNVCIYLYGKTILVARTTDPEPTGGVIPVGLIKWNELCQYIGFQNGNEAVIHINLTHGREAVGGNGLIIIDDMA
ncbi:MAG: hypothetical protein LBI45_02175 [Bacteroidales bacterium]|jgi:hypothetical protein|nr:hypothetical protein [Bacteroidales bacterium]